MRTHQEIDERSLALARALVMKIDADPKHSGLYHARKVCARWAQRRGSPALEEWQRILKLPWSEIRLLLLEDSERARWLRQNSPFCGVLSNKERWHIYREFRDHEQE